MITLYKKSFSFWNTLYHSLLMTHGKFTNGIEHHQYLIKMGQGKINEKERSEKLTVRCNKFMLSTRLKANK